MKTAILLALMVSLIPPANQKHNGENEADARTRYGMIADAIASEAQGNAQLALLLLVVARYESTFARTVHTGKTRGDSGESWGLFQVRCGKSPRASVPGTTYKAREIVGVDEAATKRATFAAAVHLRKHLGTCKGSTRCTLRIYMGATGNSPAVRKRLDARVATYFRLRQATKK